MDQTLFVVVQHVTQGTLGAVFIVLVNGSAKGEEVRLVRIAGRHAGKVDVVCVATAEPQEEGRQHIALISGRPYASCSACNGTSDLVPRENTVGTSLQGNGMQFIVLVLRKGGHVVETVHALGVEQQRGPVFVHASVHCEADRPFSE